MSREQAQKIIQKIATRLLTSPIVFRYSSGRFFKRESFFVFRAANIKVSQLQCAPLMVSLPFDREALTGKGSFALVGTTDANVAQAVERILGKDEVGGSNPLVGSTLVVFLSQLTGET